MNRLVKAVLAVAGGLVMGAAVAGGPDVGVSIEISQPGVFGRIDLGRFPQPQVIVQRPIVIAPAPRMAQPEPVYLWVPPGHQRNWRRYCNRYGACGVPVYFVRDGWYRENVSRDQGRYRDDRREDRRDERRDDRRDWREDGRRDHGQGHGHGHGRGRGED